MEKDSEDMLTVGYVVVVPVLTGAGRIAREVDVPVLPHPVMAFPQLLDR